MFLNFICFVAGTFVGLVLTCLVVAGGKDD